MLSEGIDLDTIRQYIENQLKDNPDLLPTGLYKFFQDYMKLPSGSSDYPELQENSEEIRKNNITFLNLIVKLVEPIIKSLDTFYTTTTNMLFVHLITGRISEIPQDWFSKVFTMSIFGSPVVVAIASQFADPKLISDEFRNLYTETFGKDRPKIT